MAEYYPAEYGKENFNCPRCGVYAQLILPSNSGHAAK